MELTIKPKAPSGIAHPARRKKVFFWLALMVLFLVFVVAVVEITLRVLYREEEVMQGYFGRWAFVQDAVLGYRHAPGFRGFAYRRGAFEIPVTISQNGLRQADFEAQMQYPARLLLLGDSFTFGLGVEEDSVFATLIQNELNPKGLGVINGGQSGYGVTQEARLGISLAPTVKPAMIILCLFPNNDVSGDFYQDYKKIEVRYGCRLFKTRWLPMPAVDFLRTHSYSWMIIAAAFARAGMERPGATLENLANHGMERALQPTLEALAALHEYCREKNIKLGVMMIPAAQGKNIFNDPLQRALKAKGISVLALDQKKFKRGDCFPHDAHWNARGHAKAAKQLVPFCLELFDNKKIN